MAVYKDEKTWTVQCRIRNRDGTTKQHKKRGFLTKKEAKEYESKITSKVPKCHMKLSEFYEIYLSDKKNELKYRTILTKRQMIETNILPYFGEMLLDEITAEDIQNWQNKMYEKNYEPTYLRSIANQLSGMMNHACNIYDMHTSPYRKIRKMGKADANRIDFWTFDEYQRFIQEMKDDPIYFPLFETLYYTGMREGELLALSKDMIDLANNVIHIRKTFPMEDLNYDTIYGYRNSHRSLKEGHPFERLSDQEYLRSIGAAAISDEDGKLHPTAAGMLMFGDEYNIVRHFPEYFLDYREELDPTTRWSDRLQSSSGEWSGNVCDFYFRVYNKIIKDIKVPFKMVGGERVDDTPVHKALREALANCLINADYHGLRGVVIRKEPDKLVLANPGYVRTGKKQMRLGGESDPRNKALMKMFNLINIGERIMVS